MRELLKKGITERQYLLIGTELLLIDRAVDAIKKANGGEAPFDIDNFSLPETPVEEILARLHLAPVQLTRRLLIIREVERVTKTGLAECARVLNAHPSDNCLVLVLRPEKDPAEKKKNYASPDDLKKAFPDAAAVDLQADAGTLRGWIKKKVRDGRLPLNDTLVRYLEEEFRDDITGLKNEFAKIANYLHGLDRLDEAAMRDLARGLCYCGIYEMADALKEGRPDALRRFEEAYPFMKEQEFAPVLARRLLDRPRGPRHATGHDRETLVDLLAQLSAIDRRVKMSSAFTRLSMEMYILRNAGVIMNGVPHGR